MQGHIILGRVEMPMAAGHRGSHTRRRYTNVGLRCLTVMFAGKLGFNEEFNVVGNP